MKPNVALILSSDGIGLLHRAGEAWNMLGEASPEGDDLGAELASLREKAAEFEPSGLHCTLVLPNDQVKFISLNPDNISGDDPLQTALEALAGATPYDVDALVVDWSLSQGHLHIAAVARETLKEAEAFASEHGFNPVCFVAAPGAGTYPGAPYFGETSTHDADDPVIRDEVPVRATGSAFMPKIVQPDIATGAEPVPEPEPEQKPEDSSADDPETIATEAPTPETAEDEPPTAAFTSIRAHGDDLPEAAPKLSGAARFFNAEDANPPPLDQPKADPEPSFAGVTDAALPGEPTPELEAPQPSLTAKAPTAKFTAFSTSRLPQPAQSQPVSPTSEPTSEKARMTVFGARDPSRQYISTRRSGMIIAAILLIPMIAIAALASMVFDDGLAGLFSGSDRAPIADTPDPGGTLEPGLQTEEDTDVAAAFPAQEEPATDTISEAADAAINQAVMASLQPPDDTSEAIPPSRETLALPEPAELTSDEARTRYAATGIWQMAPIGPQAPAATNLENLYQASIDSAVNWQDAIALPPVPATATDTRPQTLLSPPKAGTEFSRDDRGLVIATKEGALTPEGILVYAGRPLVEPPTKPGAPAQSATTGTTIDPARLQEMRPRPRPDDLAEQHERSALGGRTLAELALLRPKLRPQSAQQAAALALAEAAGSAIDAAVSEAAQSELSALAITASLKPANRPEGFSDTVAQIRAAQQAAQQPQVTPGQPIDASAVAIVTPNIPTSASIARQATEENAIKLRKINLIGVYGSPNSRRALVRLPNGRYRKVVIGDKLDGGKVAAIGDTELRYIKRGRNVVLKMPQG